MFTMTNVRYKRVGNMRLVRTERGTLIDVERYTSADVDLFGLLAMMIVWRDHVHAPLGKVELRWSQGKRSGVAVRVMLRG